MNRVGSRMRHTFISPQAIDEKMLNAINITAKTLYAEIINILKQLSFLTAWITMFEQVRKGSLGD